MRTPFRTAAALFSASLALLCAVPVAAFSPIHHPAAATAAIRSTSGSGSGSSPSSVRLGLGPDGEETTWDRLTGPKLFKTITNWEGIHSVPLVPLRILSGLLMIHHGSEGGIGPANYGTPEFNGFVEYIVQPYFSFLPGPPELWSAVHDYAEYFGGICLVLGLLTRPAALGLLVSMLGAVYFHLSSTGAQGFPLGHVPNYSYDFEEPTLYALIFLLFWFNGAGPLSVDSVIYSAISQEEEDADA